MCCTLLYKMQYFSGAFLDLVIVEVKVTCLATSTWTRVITVSDTSRLASSPQTVTLLTQTNKVRCRGFKVIEL